MKKKVWILVILVISFFLIFSFSSYFYSRYIREKERNKMLSSIALCLPPKKEGIRICCIGDHNSTDCTNKTVFECGEKIDLTVRIDNVSTHYYVCWNMSYLDSPWACTNKIYSTSFIFFEPNLEIPQITGKIPFIEIYYFPPKNYTHITDLLDDINSSTKIMSLYRDVVC